MQGERRRGDVIAVHCDREIGDCFRFAHPWTNGAESGEPAICVNGVPDRMPRDFLPEPIDAHQRRREELPCCGGFSCHVNDSLRERSHGRLLLREGGPWERSQITETRPKTQMTATCLTRCHDSALMWKPVGNVGTH